MSDTKKDPNLPDDFSKTVPNIKMPSNAPDDWSKMSHGTPEQPIADDWGKTVANLRPIENNYQDFGKTMIPGEHKAQPQDWGVTQANVDPLDFGGKRNEGDYGATMPYFKLPEADQQKYQNLPPTPSEAEAQRQKEESENKGVPAWVWISGGLFSMFLFAVGVLILVYFIVLRGVGFEVAVKGAPPGSSVLVDDRQWGTTDADGNIRLTTLQVGRRRVDIVHPSYTCEPQDVVGETGGKHEPIIARCKQKAAQATDDCGNIRLGEFDKAERCYNTALDGLPDPFTVEDLIKALNILIINFDSGKYDVPPVRLAALQKAAKYIQKVPQSVVLEIGGHTDNVGNDGSNQTLSENRAKSVREILIKYGVNPAQLEMKGYGEQKPKTTNDTEEGRFHNRRIEYSVLRK